MKRIITYGTFDLLHYGHINLLKRAKALGDYLIVVLSSDEFILSLFILSFELFSLSSFPMLLSLESDVVGLVESPLTDGLFSISSLYQSMLYFLHISFPCPTYDYWI